MENTLSPQQALRTETYKGNEWVRLIVVPLTQNLLGGIATVGALVVPLLLIWRITGWADPLAYYGAAAVGAMVTFLATLTRFFADDFGLLLAAYHRGRRDLMPELEAAYQTIDDLNAKLEKAQHVVLPPLTDAFVAPENEDTPWEDARLLLRLTRGVRLPGRKKSKLSQQRQDAAIVVIARTKMLKRIGNYYDLLCTPQEAFELLDSLLQSSNQVQR